MVLAAKVGIVAGGHEGNAMKPNPKVEPRVR